MADVKFATGLIESDWNLKCKLIPKRIDGGVWINRIRLELKNRRLEFKAKSTR